MVTVSRYTAGSSLLVLSLLIGCDHNQPLAPDAAEASLATNTGNQKGPSDLTVTASPGELGLGWRDNSPNETGFEVLRSTTGQTGMFTTVAKTAANVTTYSDPGLDPKQQYCYKIQAVAQKSILGVSNTACAIPQPLQPTPASNVDARLIHYSDSGPGFRQEGDYLLVTWTDNSSNEEGFRIARAASKTGPWVTVGTVGVGITRYQDDDLSSGPEQRCYEVVAFNTYGTAEPSNIDCSGFPFAPTSLVAVSVDGHTIDLTWTDNSEIEDGYEVRRCCEGWEVAVANLPANATSYRDVGLTVNTRYTYTVRAKKDLGYTESAYLSVFTADAPPSVPTDVQAVPQSSTSVSVSWTSTPIPVVDGYRVERSTDGGASWVPAEGVDEGLSPDQPVCYRVFAFNARGDSGPSDTDCTTPPLRPTGLTATTVDYQTIDFAWSDNSAVEDGYALGVFIYYYDEYGSEVEEFVRVWEGAANETSARVTGLEGGTSYTYYVVAVKDVYGRSDHSDGVTGTTDPAPPGVAGVMATRTHLGSPQPRHAIKV